MFDANLLNPFPHIDTFLAPLQQITFENIVAKGEIAQNKQFPLMSQCFQLYKKIILSFNPLLHTDDI